MSNAIRQWVSEYAHPMKTDQPMYLPSVRKVFTFCLFERFRIKKYIIQTAKALIGQLQFGPIQKKFLPKGGNSFPLPLRVVLLTVRYIY